MTGKCASPAGAASPETAARTQRPRYFFQAPAAFQAAHERIRAGDLQEFRRITERLHIRLNLLKLLRERAYLLHLIVDHLHRLRDVLRVHP